MVKRSLLTISVLAITAPAVRAQPTDSPAPAPAAAGDPFQKGTIGFAFPITLLTNLSGAFAIGGEPVPTVDILYVLDNKAVLDLIVGLNLHKEQVTTNAVPPTTTDQTVFGIAAGIGYRMYKHVGSLHTFMEPEVVIAWPDTGATESLDLRAAGYFGVERMLTEWMSLSGAIGVGLDAANKFNNLQVATNANLAANLYWK